MENKRYYHDYLDRNDDRPSPLPDVNETEMLVLLAIKIQIRHCIWDKLTDYWANN